MCSGTGGSQGEHAVCMAGILSMTIVNPFKGGSQSTSALFSIPFLFLTELSSKEVGPFAAKHRLQRTKGQAQKLQPGLTCVFTCFAKPMLLRIIQASGHKQL